MLSKAKATVNKSVNAVSKMRDIYTAPQSAEISKKTHIAAGKEGLWVGAIQTSSPG